MSTRPFLFLYISEHSRRKLLEWHEMMHRYGIEVRGVPYPSQRWEDIPEDAERRLRDARGNALGVLVDNSELVVPGTEVAAARDHLRLVEHLCRATFYWFSADGTIARKTYEGRARGYLDLRDGEADGWWDDRFRMEGTGETPSAWRERTGSKVSARDHVIAQIIAEHVQTRPRDFQFSGIVPGRPVDFRRLVLDDLEEHPFYARESVRRFGLLGMFRHVANMGVHFRAPVDKRGSVLWDPGLHGGVPTTPKRDAFHEDTYLAHDIGHHLLPRPLYTGARSELLRRVELVANMLSEGTTMVLADMAFVDAIRASGFDYDYGMRAIWPLFAATGLSGAPIPTDRLRELVLANGLFCATGSADAWRALLADPSDTVPLDRYVEAYGKFFRADLVWNAANWRDRLRRNGDDREERPGQFRRWWKMVQPIVRTYNLGLDTLESVAAASGAQEGDGVETLVRKVGTYLFERRIQPVLTRVPDPLPRPMRLGRAFARWMAGQLMAYVPFDFIPEMRAEADLIVDALCRHPVRTDDDVARLRDLFERRMELLAERGMLPKADAAMFREMVPHVSPKFVGYAKVAESHEEAARRLLEGRTDDREPGVGTLIRCRETRRTIWQRKDTKHPNVLVQGRLSLFGGSIDPGEEPEDALPRELNEELANRLLIAEIMGCAAYRRRFRLSADPWPGHYDLYVFEAVVDRVTFDRWACDFAARGTVLEGMVAILEPVELQEALASDGAFLCSHNKVATELLSAA